MVKVLQCPKCNVRLVIRTRKSDGVLFYGCPNFPVCKYSKPNCKARSDSTRKHQMDSRDSGTDIYGDSGDYEINYDCF